jgi:hypothetical protein
MTHVRRFTLILAVAAAAAVAATAALGAGHNGGSSMSMSSSSKTTMTAADLRVTLDNLLGEHAVLAMNATDAGYSGAKNFTAIATQLDKNSVALSKAIASFYGKSAGNTFLNGKFMWRAHIGFFVDYTVALAKHNKAGQTKAVANLNKYVQKFGAFLAGATGLPVAAVRGDLIAHVTQLKQQLDAYAAGQYKKANTIYNEAYNHMFMTGDTLAGAIAKQKGLS